MAQEWKDYLGAIKCPRCDSKFAPPELGFYDCGNCGFHERVEYALVRSCYENVEDMTLEEVERFTGVAQKNIMQIRKELRLERNELEDGRHGCQRCGASIMYGRYCKTCKRELLGELRGSF